MYFFLETEEDTKTTAKEERIEVETNKLPETGHYKHSLKVISATQKPPIVNINDIDIKIDGNKIYV